MNVYFDNAATTPLDKGVLSKMLPYMEEGFGNPSSIHKKGREIKAAIEKSRSKIADLLSCEPGEIFFTSGGTEADNMFMINTVVEKKINTIITTKLEHHAVLHCCEYLKNTYNTQIKFVKTDELGEVDFDDLDNVLRENQNSLVSLMHGNNEIGNINDIEKISNICAQYGVIFHSDTVQTMGHYKLNLNEINVHGVVGSAHKFHGPKGIGFLYLNNNHKISPFILTSGAVNLSTLMMAFPNVDLPEPDKPITTNISPFETSKEALFTPTMHPIFWNVFASTFPFASWSIFLAFSPKIL